MPFKAKYKIAHKVTKKNDKMQIKMQKKLHIARISTQNTDFLKLNMPKNHKNAQIGSLGR